MVGKQIVHTTERRVPLLKRPAAARQQSTLHPGPRQGLTRRQSTLKQPQQKLTRRHSLARTPSVMGPQKGITRRHSMARQQSYLPGKGKPARPNLKRRQSLTRRKSQLGNVRKKEQKPLSRLGQRRQQLGARKDNDLLQAEALAKRRAPPKLPEDALRKAAMLGRPATVREPRPSLT